MKKFIASMRYALKGIAYYFEERNAKIQVSMAIVYAVIAFSLNFQLIEWCIFLLCCALVFTAEAINTAIEYIVDFISPEHNEKAGKIKDIAAGAVLISALLAGVIGILLILNKLIPVGLIG